MFFEHIAKPIIKLEKNVSKLNKIQIIVLHFILYIYKCIIFICKYGFIFMESHHMTFSNLI